MSRATALSIGLAALLALSTIALYAPVHDHPFANLDDGPYVTNNEHIRNGLTLGTVRWSLLHFHSSNWHPLTWMSHALDIDLFGLNPAGPHDENVLLHAVNVVLLFCVLKGATGCSWRSLMVAALFALHPLNVENVAWIAERKTLLSTLFFLLALEAYGWYARRPRIGRYATVALLYTLGLFCKPQVITLPFVLLLWDYWPLGRMFAKTDDVENPNAGIKPESFRWLVIEKVPLFLIALGDAAMTTLAQRIGAPTLLPYAFSIRLYNAFFSYLKYLLKAFWPLNLGLYYTHPGDSLRWWQGCAALLLVAGITVLFFANRRHRYLLVGWLWFLGTLVPMIGVMQVDVHGMADRYAYVSLLGIFIILCWGLADWAKMSHFPAALAAISVLVLVALAGLTHRQVGYWRDNVTLWSHSAKVSPESWKPEYFLGRALDDEHRSTDAYYHYRTAASLGADDIHVDYSIGSHAELAGDTATALEYYQKVLRESVTATQKTEIMKKIGSAYASLGDTARADEYYARANTVPPDSHVLDWNGAWWKQAIPAIRAYLAGKSANR